MAPRSQGYGDFCLPSVARTSVLLQEAGTAPIRGKEIRIARALLVTAGSEGSNRKDMAHSVSEPDTAMQVGKRAKYRKAPYLVRPAL
jgi:hypothetical protein